MEEKGHGKSIVELIETREVIEGCSVKSNMSYESAALTLIFNELRCIHWHLDQEMEAKNES